MAHDKSGYAVLTDGTAWAWGYGLQGDLGNGQLANSSVPVQITGITSPVRSVTPGGANLMAIGTDGSVWSWGRTGFGITGGGGQGANPGRLPRLPAASAVYSAGFAWWAAVS
jgi:alpha-tubulin suppressor-like RCC1 family protein